MYGNKGSTDQHAYVQQLRDGVDNFFVTFIEVLEDTAACPVINDQNPGDFLDGFLQGTRSALTESDRQNMSITMQRFDARRLGALIALFERAVGLLRRTGEHQCLSPAGRRGRKKAAAAVLGLQAKVEAVLNDRVARSVAEIRQVLGDESDESIFWILRHLAGNNRGYVAQGDWANPASMRFSKS